MAYKSLKIERFDTYVKLIIARPEKQNSISAELLREINHILDEVESDPKCKCVIIEGSEEIFCTGLDFDDISSFKEDVIRKWTSLYMSTLKRFTTSPKVIISKITGKTIAGGVGLAAASDIIIANEKASFKLSEAIFGLLPAMVSPFLIRRIGFQKAYSMMLLTNTIHAQEAHQIHLIDLLNNDLEKAIIELLFRFSRIESETVKQGKQLFRKMWTITEEMEKTAIEQTTHLLLQSHIQQKILNFHYQV